MKDHVSRSNAWSSMMIILIGFIQRILDDARNNDLLEVYKTLVRLEQTNGKDHPFYFKDES
jgi:hypothetical protein